MVRFHGQPGGRGRILYWLGAVKRVSPGSLRAGTGVTGGGQREVDRALVLLLSVDFPPVPRETLLTAELVMTGTHCVEDSSGGVTLSLALSTPHHALTLNILSLLSYQGFPSLKLDKLLNERMFSLHLIV